MKRLLALTMAGVMLFSAPVIAAEEEDEVVEDVEDGDEGEEDEEGGSRSPSASAIKAEPKEETAETPASAVEAEPVSAAIIQAAAAEGKTVGEYLNNAVATVPGLANAVPIAQGGHVIINGAPSNQVFSVLKPTSAQVSSAKIHAATLGGSVLTVVRINASISGFQTARVNFYMKGIKAGQNIKVYQIVNGRWVEIDVVEIRADHVVVDMTALGTLAFIEVPNP